jgi:nucleoid-associated protein YgaU
MRVGAVFGEGRAAVRYAALAGGIAVAGIVAFLALRGGEDTPAPDVAAAPEAGEVAPQAVGDTRETETVEAVPEAVVEDAPEAVAGTADAPTVLPPDPPRFDQIRVAPDGATVVAGRGPAGSDVRLLLDGAEVAAAPAASDGGFAAIFALPPSETPRIMTLVARLPEGGEVAGVESVIISPFGGQEAPEAVASAAPDAAPGTEPATSVEPPAGDLEIAAADVAAGAGAEVAAERSPPEAPAPGDSGAVPEVADGAAPAPAEETAAHAATAPSADGTPVDEAPAVETAAVDTAVAPVAPGDEAPTATPPETVAGVAAPEPPAVTEAPAAAIGEAPSIVIAGPEGLRVVQSAGDTPDADGPAAPPRAQTEVRLDAIAYDLEGGVVLSGRGPADTQVQILLDNRPIELGEIGPGGNWSLDLPDVDPGTYTLTVAQLSPEGEIEARVDTPFLREDPARIAASPMLVEAGVSVITVQPGFTLWGIAEANFGEGIAYVQIFERNRGAIRDPDLIFPGQIFSLPDLPRTNPVP